MESYTAMSDEAVEATKAAMAKSGEPYPMTLGIGDFSWLMRGLQAITEECKDGELRDWAADFASSIGQTLDIEFV